MGGVEGHGGSFGRLAFWDHGAVMTIISTIVVFC